MNWLRLLCRRKYHNLRKIVGVNRSWAFTLTFGLIHPWVLAPHPPMHNLPPLLSCFCQLRCDGCGVGAAPRRRSCHPPFFYSAPGSHYPSLPAFFCEKEGTWGRELYRLRLPCQQNSLLKCSVCVCTYIRITCCCASLFCCQFSLSVCL